MCKFRGFLRVQSLKCLKIINLVLHLAEARFSRKLKLSSTHDNTLVHCVNFPFQCRVNKLVQVVQNCPIEKMHELSEFIQAFLLQSTPIKNIFHFSWRGRKLASLCQKVLLGKDDLQRPNRRCRPTPGMKRQLSLFKNLSLSYYLEWILHFFDTWKLIYNLDFGVLVWIFVKKYFSIIDKIKMNH